jgi:transcriptional regulator with XRE-family HTH domain
MIFIKQTGGIPMREYATRLRDLRTDRDLSQMQIAVILGTTKNQVGKYERGEQELPIRHLITLCNYYGVSADYILGLPKGRPYGFSKTT